MVPSHSCLDPLVPLAVVRDVGTLRRFRTWHIYILADSTLYDIRVALKRQFPVFDSLVVCEFFWQTETP